MSARDGHSHWRKVRAKILPHDAEQRRVEREQRFLAGVGEMLMTASPDYEATLSEIARAAAGELADWVIVDIIGSSEIRRLKVAHADPGKVAIARALEQLPLERGRAHLMGEVVRAGRTALVPCVTSDYLRSVAQSEEHLELLRSLEPRSFLAVPLMARGRLVGGLGLISSQDSRRYGERDLRLVQQLARLAALAVDNAQLHQASLRAAAAREEVLGIVAHDLRNPLQTIVMASELLSAGALDPQLRGPIDTIGRAAARIDRMVRDILDAHQADNGALALRHEQVSAAEMLAEVAEAERPAATSASLEIALDAAGRLPDVCGDRDRLLQVFENLIGNAIKFTPPGGRITVGGTPRGDQVLFWVGDTGSGIPAATLPHVFDRFWRERSAGRQGAGLGLAIVEAHGGRVWVESEEGLGTSFYFTLPAAAAAKDSPPGASPM